MKRPEWVRRRGPARQCLIELHYYSVNCGFADRNAISKSRAGRVEQRRDASQNWATLSGKFISSAPQGHDRRPSLRSCLDFAGSNARAGGHATRMDSGSPEPSARCYGVTMLPSPPPASPLGEPLPSETSTTSMSKMSLRPASGWLASMVTESSPRAVMRTGTVWPFSRRS